MAAFTLVVRIWLLDWNLGMCPKGLMAVILNAPLFGMRMPRSILLVKVIRFKRLLMIWPVS